MAEVEILLATYQGERFIEAQIASILAQSYSDFKLLIRDDGSTDKTLDLIGKFFNDPRVELISSRERLGVRGSFEALLKASQADYLLFSDQDDVWEPSKVEVMLNEIKRQESLHSKSFPLLIHSDLKVVDKDLHLIAPSFWQRSKICPDRAIGFSRHLFQNPVTGCATLFNRALAEKALPIPCKAVLHDHWLSLSAAAFGKRVALPQPLVSYRQHEANVVGAKGYSFLSYLLSGIKKLLNAEGAYKGLFEQAEAFRELHSQTMNPKDLAALEAFIALPRKGFWTSRLLILRHHLYKQGTLRNLGLLFTPF